MTFANDTWWVFVNGQRIGELYRDTWRVFVNGQRIGELCRDRWDNFAGTHWTLSVGDRRIALQSGLTAAQAKRAARQHL
jgi:hypothetical protein